MHTKLCWNRYFYNRIIFFQKQCTYLQLLKLALRTCVFLSASCFSTVPKITVLQNTINGWPFSFYDDCLPWVCILLCRVRLCSPCVSHMINRLRIWIMRELILVRNMEALQRMNPPVLPQRTLGPGDPAGFRLWGPQSLDTTSPT